MGANQSSDEELRREILDRLHNKGEQPSENDESVMRYLAREIKDRALLGKDIIQGANPVNIGKAALHQLGTYGNMMRRNSRLRRERKILRELVDEKRRKKNEARMRSLRKSVIGDRINDIKRTSDIARVRVTDPEKADEMETEFEEEQRQKRAEAQEIARQRAMRAGKRERRRSGWDGEDTKNLAYGGPWGLIASAVRHKRLNDINDLEDEYKDLEEEGYGFVHPLFKQIRKQERDFKYLNGLK